MKTAAIALVIVALLTPPHTRQARRLIHAFRSSDIWDFSGMGSARTDPRGGTVNYFDSESLRLMTRERLDQRTREADAERLAREIRGTEKRSRRRRLTIGLALRTSHRATRPRLEA